ncbi:MAG: hypothetical protein JWP44_1701 [Mucilaginibacter sp.]|nr:hypothetical protein [Mucilaginibacter sp.]
MKKMCTLVLIVVSSRAFSQDSLKAFNYSRNRITTTGMEVLGGWAVAHLGIGAIGWADSKSGSNKYYYKMDFLWNTVNLGAAILGYTSARKGMNKQLTPAESLKEQQKIEKTFLINGGLDVVYIGTGVFLKQRGDNRKNDQLKGYGSSITVQGAFLLLFDATMYTAQKHNGSKLIHFLEKNPVTFNGKQIGILFNI